MAAMSSGGLAAPPVRDTPGGLGRALGVAAGAGGGAAALPAAAGAVLRSLPVGPSVALLGALSRLRPPASPVRPSDRRLPG